MYFQPDRNSKLKYPCILYQLDGSPSEYADNIKYVNHKLYLVTVVDTNPDSNIPECLEKLDLCEFDRFYTSSNLNHFVFRLYF